MEKVLKITEQPQGKSYVPGFRIAGKALENFNFLQNDYVIIKFKKNKIEIENATPTQDMRRMAQINPELINMMQALQLQVTKKLH